MSESLERLRVAKAKEIEGNLAARRARPVWLLAVAGIGLLLMTALLPLVCNWVHLQFADLQKIDPNRSATQFAFFMFGAFSVIGGVACIVGAMINFTEDTSA